MRWTLMPKAFTDCVAAGGRVRTKRLSKGRYLHICFLKGKSYPGEVKMKMKGKIQVLKDTGGI